MTIAPPKRAFDWEAAGLELGKRLGQYNALVVIGSDPVATGRVAVGLARTQAVTRRVAVGDLFAESPPIQDLVESDDPHGLVDSFLYGVSLSRIAYLVPGAGQLYVMPSGTEPPTYEDILPNPRWHRLAAGFREVKALLVLAVPASAPHIDDLVAATDGAILVGDAIPSGLSVSRVIGSVREPRRAPSDILVPADIAVPVPDRWSKWRIASVAGIALTLVAAAVAAWLAYRPLAKGGRPTTGRNPDTTRGLTQVNVTRADTSIRDSTLDTAAAALVTVPRVANPADSAIASAFAVQLMAANTQAGAILKLQQDGKDLPAATFASVLVQGARWFKVISGAYPTRSGADSLLDALKKRKKLIGDEGVARLPFAFLIDSVPATAVPGTLATYADRGQPVYALRQQNGTAWLLVGAFESPEQSSLYAASLRASNITPVLVYRKGRPF
ncbi:MAG: SPOR domain-containing protein [bacterium]